MAQPAPGDEIKDFGADLEHALKVISQGGVVGYPSETVWGLAAYSTAWERLAQRKGREASKPMQVSCADAGAALPLCVPSPLLLDLFTLLPGPLTIVTRAEADCPAPLAPGGWVGVRVPDHPLAQSFLAQTGPLLTTSLNPAGQPAARTYEEALNYGLADTLLGRPGDQAGGLASTVIQLPALAGEAAFIQRVGAMPIESLRPILSAHHTELVVR